MWHGLLIGRASLRLEAITACRQAVPHRFEATSPSIRLPLFEVRSQVAIGMQCSRLLAQTRLDAPPSRVSPSPHHALMLGSGPVQSASSHYHGPAAQYVITTTGEGSAQQSRRSSPESKNVVRITCQVLPELIGNRTGGGDSTRVKRDVSPLGTSQSCSNAARAALRRPIARNASPPRSPTAADLAPSRTPAVISKLLRLPQLEQVPTGRMIPVSSSS